MDNSPAPSVLLSIPIEVLLRIADNLTTPELGALRATCKPIENMLFNTFAEEFFSQKQFMFTEFSLQALIEISKSRMGQFIRRLQFSVEQIRSDYLFHHDSSVRAIYQSRQDFWDNGKDQQMLPEALRNLPNLEDVIIRDVDSRKRTRDYPKCSWRSYGRATEEAKGIRYTVTPGGGNLTFHTTRVFKSVVNALGLAEKYPMGLEMISRRGSYISDEAFEIPENLQPTFLPVLEKLEKLHLSVALADMSGNGDDTDHDSAFFLCKFLSYTKNLKNLRINGDRDERTGLNAFLAHLGNPALPLKKGGDQGLSLPNLEEFSLGMTMIQQSDLTSIARALAPSLRSFELWKVLMQKSDDNDDPFHDDDSASSRPQWVHAFKELTRIPEFSPRHIMFGALQDHYNSGRRVQIEFGLDDANRAAYTGPDCKRYLQETIPTIHYGKETRPARPVYIDNGIDDDENEYDEDSDHESDEDEDEDEEDDAEADADADVNAQADAPATNVTN